MLNHEQKPKKKKECRWSVLPCCFSSWCNCGFSELQVAPNSSTHVEYELAKIGHSWDGWPSLNSMFEAPSLSARDASDGKSLQLTSPKWLTELLAQKHGKATDWSAHIPVWLTPSMSKWWSTISFPLHRSEWTFWGLTQIGLCFTACMGWFFDRAGMITCTELIYWLHPSKLCLCNPLSCSLFIDFSRTVCPTFVYGWHSTNLSKCSAQLQDPPNALMLLVAQYYSTRSVPWKFHFPIMYPNFWLNSSSNDQFNLWSKG